MLLPSSESAISDRSASRTGRRLLSIEAALRWAYQVELPNLKAAEADVLSSSLGRLAAPKVDGGRSDWDADAISRVVAPDALALADAVTRLREHELEPPDGLDAATKRAFVAHRGRAETLVIVHARLGTRPEIGEAPECGPRFASNGRPMVLRVVGRRERLITGKAAVLEAEEIVLGPPARGRGHGEWPIGSACPLEWFPTFESVARDRAEAEIWRQALAWLARQAPALDRIEIDAHTLPPHSVGSITR